LEIKNKNVKPSLKRIKQPQENKNQEQNILSEGINIEKGNKIKSLSTRK
jgi:hypothetical protein